MRAVSGNRVALEACWCVIFGQLVTTKLGSSKRFPTRPHSFNGLPSARAAQCCISKGNCIGLNDENTLSPFSEPTLGNRSDKWGHRHFSSRAQLKLSPEQGGPTESQEWRRASAVGQRWLLRPHPFLRICGQLIVV